MEVVVIFCNSMYSIAIGVFWLYWLFLLHPLIVGVTTNIAGFSDSVRENIKVIDILKRF